MDVREERGKAIADTGLIRKSKSGELVYLVPSQSGNGQYSVDLAGDEPTCTCPDWELRRTACKHVYAVASAEDGSAQAQPFKLVENALATFPLSLIAQSGALASPPARRS